MKTKHLLFSSVLVVVAGWSAVFFLNAVSTDDSASYKYIPRAFEKGQQKAENGPQGAAELLWKMRVNPHTGTISREDIERAEKSFENFKLAKGGKSSGSLNWQFVGPDDVGGRTRAFMVDKRDNKTLWAAGVAGGLWKSTTNGLSWIPVDINNFNNLSISSICQDDDNNFYIGTGEYFAGTVSTNTTSRGFEGNGIYKSTDGTTFTRLESTNENSNFSIVNKIVYSSVNNALYAATTSAVMISTDGGVTWGNPYGKFGIATDVEVGSDGTVVFAMNSGEHRVYVVQAGTNTAVSKASYFDTGFDRIEVAISPSDPNYMYALCSYTPWSAANTDKYFNLYYSVDKGESWVSAVLDQTPSLDIFRNKSQGYYDNTISVFPTDPTSIIFGGIDLWTWSFANGFEQISYWSGSGQKYVHADQHNIVFHPDFENNHTVYFTNDGGIFASYDAGFSFQALNKNYGVTQYYALDCGPNGEILGGCQDNGSPYMDLLQPSDPLSSREVTGGDGGYSAISELYYGAVFTTIYHSELRRSNENGIAATMQYNPFDEGLKSTSASLRPGNAQNPFVTPIALWESFNYLDNRIYFPYVVDTVIRPNEVGIPVVDSAFAEGYTFLVKSKTVNNKTFEYKVTAQDIANNGDSLRPGDTIVMRERYAAMMAIGGYKMIYFTRDILNFKESLINWDAVVGLTKFGASTDLIYNNANIGVEQLGQLKWSKDGSLLFATSNGSKGKAFIFKGFEDAYSYKGLSYDKIITSKDTVFNVSTNNITNVQLLQSNPINVWSVTYSGNTNKHVIALDTTTSSLLLDLYHHYYNDCDTNVINNIYSSSVDSSYTSTEAFTSYSLDAGSLNFSNIYRIDSSYQSNYLVDFNIFDREDCSSNTITGVDADTVLNVTANPFVSTLDSVYTTNNQYANVLKIDTTSFSPDTILNLIRKTYSGYSCNIDTVFDINIDTIANTVSYNVEYDNYDVNTPNTLIENIVSIDSLLNSVDTLINIYYKDQSSGCALLSQMNINIDSVSNFISSTEDYNTLNVQMSDTTYSNIVRIDTIGAESLINIVYQDTTYEMGVVEDGNMTWNDREINTTDKIIGKNMDVPNDDNTYITSVEVDPNNNNRVLVTIGGYSNDPHVYFTENALDDNIIWNSVDGNLPKIPVYASLISDSTGTVILGTEFGVFSTESLNGSATSWVYEESMPKVPVFHLTQQIQPNGYIDGVCQSGVKNSGEIYAGTHGLGAWKMDNFKRPLGITPIHTQIPDALTVKVYPNPVVNTAKVEYALPKDGDVSIEVYDLSGRKVYTEEHKSVPKGKYITDINANDYQSGVYILSLTVNNERKVSKFIVE
ncbi:MAG: T9SS type A sorting domain-containing protein [Bacteroidales bacterium]|nr:T9SS type A sorting domain-containing protein [Bacteroidales bacterium]